MAECEIAILLRSIFDGIIIILRMALYAFFGSDEDLDILEGINHGVVVHGKYPDVSGAP